MIGNLHPFCDPPVSLLGEDVGVAGSWCTTAMF
jgi:hypothetical protein